MDKFTNSGVSERLRNRRVLIVGGGGFIGAWLAHELLGHGARVDLLDDWQRQGTSADSLGILNNPDVRTIHGDILSPECFQSLEPSYNYIVHAAAILGIRRVCIEPTKTMQVNVLGTERCLEFARRNNCLDRFMTFSTSEVYGPDSAMMSEKDHATVPSVGNRWCYAASKLAAEWFTKAFALDYDLPTVIIRPFNVYGPHRKGTNAVTQILSGALTDRPIMISGSGTQVRAWCYITDFIDGLITALTKDLALGEVFNLGNPHEIFSVLDLGKMAISVTNSASTLVITGSTEPDVVMRAPDIGKAQRVLGYRPQVSLHEGLKATAKWLDEANRQPLLRLAA